MVFIGDNDPQKLREALRCLNRQGGIAGAKRNIKAVLQSIEDLGHPAPYNPPAALSLPKCARCELKTVTDGSAFCSECERLWPHWPATEEGE